VRADAMSGDLIQNTKNPPRGARRVSGNPLFRIDDQ
jgi:hypothetical protein